MSFLLLIGCALQAGLLTGCSVADLQVMATEDPEAGNQATRFRNSDEPEVLIPVESIHGGASFKTGAMSEFTRIMVGGDGEAIKFQKPVAVGGYGNFLYVLDGELIAGESIQLRNTRTNSLRITERGAAVYRYNLTDKTIELIGQVGQHMKGEATNIFVEPDLSFYLADPVGKRVLYFSKNGNLIREYIDLVNLSRPIDVLSDDTTGNVYVADGSFSHVVVFSKLGTPMRAIGGRGTGPGKFRAITAITKVPDNTLYVADRLELPVQELSMGLGDMGQFRYSLGLGEVIWPTAVAIDRERRVFVSDKSDNTIKVFDEIRLIATLGGTGSAPGRFRLITDMWMSKQQRLYVADSLNRRVQVFDVVPEEGQDKDLFIIP